MTTTSKPPEKSTRAEENARKVEQVLKDAKQQSDPKLAEADLEQIRRWYQHGFKSK